MPAVGSGAGQTSTRLLAHRTPMLSIAETFAVDEASSLGTNGKTSFPDYPEENPSKLALQRWCDTWYEDLSTAGYSAVLRGEEPFALKKYAPRALLTVPADEPGKSHIEAKNADIQASNDINLEEKTARLREIHNSIAHRLKRALRPRAGLLLKTLLKKHIVKDSGTDIPDCYDGVAMFKELRKKCEDEVSDYDSKRYQRAYEKIRDTKLPSNCSPSVFSTRVATFERDINPYLDTPLEGAKLSQFIIDMLPEDLASDARSLRRDLKTQSKFDDADHVALCCQRLIEDAFSPGKRHGVDINLLHLLDTPSPQQQTSPPSSDKSYLTKADAEKLVKALTKTKREPSSQGGGEGGKATFKFAASKLPEGQRCKEGTCNINHDAKRPGERCYRPPSFERPLPLRTWNDPRQMGSILADRKVEAVRLGIPLKELKPPKGGAAKPAGTTATVGPPPSSSRLSTNCLSCL